MRAAAILFLSTTAVVIRDATADCTPTTRCVTVLATATPTSLAISASRVFWTDAAGRIESISKLGGAPTVVAQSQDGATLDGVEGGRLYWHTPSDVRRAVEGGGAIEPLYSYRPGSGRFVAVALTPQALFVTSDATIWRLALDGTTPAHAPGSLVAHRSSLVTFVGSTARAWRDAYLLEDGTQIHVDGNASLAADTSHGLPALFVLAAHRLVRIESGRAIALANQQDDGGRIAVAGDDVYWTNPQRGVVRKTNVYGGPIDVVALGQSRPTLLAADADGVVWASTRGIVRATPR